MKKHIFGITFIFAIIFLTFTVTAFGLDNTVKQIEAGNKYTFVLTNDGTLYGCGNNSHGVLGPDVEMINDGSVWNVVARPAKIAEGVKAVATNTNIMWNNFYYMENGVFKQKYVGDHCLILMENGDLYAQGDNAFGQLGQGDESTYEGMQFVMSGVQKISAGDAFSVCITEDGDLYFWGKMQNQQSDGGDYAQVLTPYYLGSDFVDVDAGGGHIAAIDKNGNVWTTGCRYDGACGDGKTQGTSIELVNVFSGAVKVSAGQTHTLVLTSSGDVYGWGSNHSYQLGQYIPPEQAYVYDKCFSTPVFVMDDAIDIEAGYFNSFVVKSNGDLWGFGTNYDGQLGIGYTNYNGAPIKTATDVKSVSVGYKYTIILKNDGTTYATGNNYYYNFGNGSKLYNELCWTPALLTASPVLDPGETPFVDVDKSAYFYESVLWAVENRITAGTTPTTFSPEMLCTRGQIVTFLWRAAGSETPIIVNQYKDTDKNAYYFTAMRWCSENNICPPYEETNYRFYPNDNCTRAMAVEFMWRYAGCPDYDPRYLPFYDVNKNETYAKAVAWALDTGITQGVSETSFNPNGTCTRAQIVTFLQRLFS